MAKVEDKNNIPKLLKVLPAAKEQILRHAGAYLEGEIKETIDRSRPEWPALKLATIARKGSSQPLIDTGAMRNAVTHKPEPDQDRVLVGLFGEEAVRGASHEFGAPTRNIPQRAFIRPTFDEQKENIEKIIERDYQKVIEKSEV